MNDYCADPFYQCNVFSKLDAKKAIKYELFEIPKHNLNNIKDDLIKYIYNFTSIIENIIDDEINKEYVKCNGLGSQRGYYTFIHKNICAKISNQILSLYNKNKTAFNTLTKYVPLFIAHIYRPPSIEGTDRDAGGFIYNKLFDNTLVGKPLSNTTLPVPPLPPNKLVIPELKRTYAESIFRDPDLDEINFC